MEGQDANGTPIQLTDAGLTYGSEFVSFDEMGGVQAVPRDQAGDTTYRVVVVRKSGPDLVMDEVPSRFGSKLAPAVIERLKAHHNL